MGRAPGQGVGRCESTTGIEPFGAFERRYERTAEPFEWKFTRTDHTKLLERLADKPDFRTAA